MDTVINSPELTYAALFFLWAALIVNSLIFGVRVSLRPPEQLYNPLAVVKGVTMVSIYFCPSMYLAYYGNLGFMVMFSSYWICYGTGLGIVGTLWYVKHVAEYDAHFSMDRLAEAK